MFNVDYGFSEYIPSSATAGLHISCICHFSQDYRSFFNSFLFEVKLLYSVVSSSVQQSDSPMYIYSPPSTPPPGHCRAELPVLCGNFLVAVYTGQCVCDSAALSLGPILFSCVHISVLALQIGSSVSVFRFHVYVLIYDI